jgi:alanine racemase
MDMIVIDLTAIEARVGDAVELWGKNLSVDRVAEAASTISYEILCNAGNLCRHEYI